MDGVSPMRAAFGPHTTQPDLELNDKDELETSLPDNFSFSRDKYADAKIKVDGKIYKVIFEIIFHVNSISMLFIDSILLMIYLFQWYRLT